MINGSLKKAGGKLKNPWNQMEMKPEHTRAVEYNESGSERKVHTSLKYLLKNQRNLK